MLKNNCQLKITVARVCGVIMVSGEMKGRQARSEAGNRELGIFCCEVLDCR